MQARLLLYMTAATVVACRAPATLLPGVPFSGASLLAPPSDYEASHDELLSADLARADSVGRLGYAAGLASAFSADVMYLRGGLPIVRGRAAAMAVAAAESLATVTTVRWQPVRAEASRDGRHGYTYGYTVAGTSNVGRGPALRVDRYVAFWRREKDEWRISAYAETYGAPPTSLAMPASVLSAALADLPMARSHAAVDALRDADMMFSRYAGEVGAGEAFGRYAEAGAQIFSALGEFITGPVAISQSFGPYTTESSLVWHPVHGELAASGDLGFTVGNAVLTGKRADGVAVMQYSKYLTVWKRQRDGSWRYVVDGGNARPPDSSSP